MKMQKSLTKKKGFFWKCLKNKRNELGNTLTIDYKHGLTRFSWILWKGTSLGCRKHHIKFHMKPPNKSCNTQTPNRNKISFFFSGYRSWQCSQHCLQILFYSHEQGQDPLFSIIFATPNQTFSLALSNFTTMEKWR